jgi:beta-lactam-binding protein with PASTA domain
MQYRGPSQQQGEQMAKKVAVPSLVGTTVDSAETALTDAGLGVVKRYVSGEPDGTIYSQEPRFPGKLAKGEVVTVDILRAPKAPESVDLSGVTKSIGELNKAVAELKAAAADLTASVGEIKTSAATKDEIGTLGKSIQELRDAVGKAATAAVQAAATRVQAQGREPSPAPAPSTPPAEAEKPAEDGGS